MKFLSEDDTFFGATAFRNGLIEKEQLGQAVGLVGRNPGMRLGEAMVQLGFLRQDQVDAILSIQKRQREILADRADPNAAESRPSKPAQDPPLTPPPSDVAASDPTPRITQSKIPEPEGPAPEGAPAGRAPQSVNEARTELLEEPLDVADEKPAPSEPEAPSQLEPQPESAPVSGSAEAADASPSSETRTEEPAEPTPEMIKPQGDLSALADFLSLARSRGASDLHIAADQKPFLRRNGGIEFLDVEPLSAPQAEHLMFGALSNERKRHLLENRALEFCLDLHDGRYRSCIFKERLGWDGSFRVVRREIPSFDDLGLPDAVKRLTTYHQGLVLVTGGTNSGKTTTLAALIDEINRTRKDHIITIEDPIEYVHVSKECQVTQREAGLHTESFATALRAALREDPDVVMVGELRDLETLSMAISASETGHLVFGTLHTTSAARTVSRVVDGFPVGQQAQIRMMLSESLRGILSQQLLPRKDGNGQALAIEILFVTQAVSALLRDNKPFQIPSLIQTGRKIGMQRMDDALLDLVNRGIVDGKEAFMRAENKQAFKQFA